MRSFSAFRRRAVNAVKNYFHRDWKFEDLVNTHHVSRFQRLHLIHFYFTLICASASSAVGSCFYPTGRNERLFAMFAACLSFICFYQTRPWKENKRIFFLMCGAFFGWTTVTPWVSWLLGVDTGFVATIMLSICVGFACLWTSCKWSGRFEVVYINGTTLSIPLILLCLWISSGVFGGTSARWMYLLYVSLLWYMGFVVAYSREVVMKARQGETDYVKHAVCLFTHFPPFFIHLIKEFRRFMRL